MNIQTFQNFQVKNIRIAKNFEWIIWNRVVTIKCMLINFGWIKRKRSVSSKWNAFMLRNPDFQLLLSFTYIGGRTPASILINNRRSKWKWDAIFEFKEILNRVTGLENNSSIDLRIEMFDNRLKPAFHPKRLNTKKGNFQNYITCWYSYDRRFAIIQRTKRFCKHPIQYR